MAPVCFALVKDGPCKNCKYAVSCAIRRAVR